MDFMAVYAEAGMIGIVGVMFVYLVISLSKKSDAQQETLKNLEGENKGQSETLENTEGMIIKLIERWNESDAVRKLWKHGYAIHGSITIYARTYHSYYEHYLSILQN